MVWQEKIGRDSTVFLPCRLIEFSLGLVVMLCQLVENNKKKADLYWPPNVGDVKKFKGYRIGHLFCEFSRIFFLFAELTIENRSVREREEDQMRVTHLVVKGRSTKTGEIREHNVTHIMWRAWPDRVGGILLV